jgi:phage-related minor tail protein
VLSDAFKGVFSSLETSIGRAARTGEFSIRGMVDAMLRDLARLAFDDLVEKPLSNFIESAIGNLMNFGGARASGGPVSAAHAYLVGERGPELFVPAGAGRIEANGARSAPVIHFNVTASDAESFRRSETQIAAMLARAVARGQRGL